MFRKQQFLPLPTCNLMTHVVKYRPVKYLEVEALEQ